MTAAQVAIIDEATAVVAAHYAEKMIAEGVTPTAEQLGEAIKANWPKVAQEIARLAAQAEQLLAV